MLMKPLQVLSAIAVLGSSPSEDAGKQAPPHRTDHSCRAHRMFLQLVNVEMTSPLDLLGTLRTPDVICAVPSRAPMAGPTVSRQSTANG